MPRPAFQASHRRILLQGILCLLLVCTVVLASFVTRYKISSLQTKLGPATAFDGLFVHLPERWSIQVLSPSPNPLLLQATEPAASTDARPRVLTIARDHVDEPLPPLEYLLSSNLMPRAYQPSLGGEGKLDLAKPCQVAGQRGLLYAGLRTVRASDGSLLPKKDVYATAMLPSRDMLTVRLEGVGAPNDDDLSLVRTIAQSLSLPAAPSAERRAVLTLADGSSVHVPDGYLSLPESDPFRTERHLLLADPPDRWSCVTLVPCVYLPGDSDDTLRSMLAARDSDWLLQAKITVAGKALRADRPAHTGISFPQRAWLLPSVTGHALLIMLRGGSPADVANWDAIVKSIADTAAPATGAKPVDLLRTGEHELARLKKIGLPTLLKAQPPEQWWLWNSGVSPVGWSHLALRHVNQQFEGISESRILRADHVLAVGNVFATADDLSESGDKLICQAAFAPEITATVFAQTSKIDSGQYAVRCDYPAGQSARNELALPEPFIPGIYLPLLLSHLTPEPMIFRTDRIPGLEGTPAVTPLTVIIRPSRAATSSSTPSTTRPSRPAFTFEISGTGYQVELTPSFDRFPNRLTRHLATRSVVDHAFAKSPLMMPRPAQAP